MGRILFAWELGRGLGHLAQLSPLISGLRAQGHEVVAAVADPGSAGPLLGDVPFLAAPQEQGIDARRILNPGSFAEILHNIGWAKEERLWSLMQSWRHLFEMVKPKIVVLDYSPTALLALHGTKIPCVQVGTGFYYPTDVSPLPDLCPWQNNYPDRLLMAEQTALSTANSCLARLGCAPLSHLTALFHRAKETFLATFEEFDHYPERPGATYWGVWSSVPGIAPDWPSSARPRVFAYLRSNDHLGEILTALTQFSGSSLVYLPDGDPQLQQRYASEDILFSSQPLDMQRVVDECDAALVYASHATVAQCLLAGKPLVAVPMHNEQLINSRNVAAIGAGICVSQLEPIHPAEALEKVLNDPSYAQNARKFADKYAEFDPQQQVNQIVERIGRYVADGGRHE